MGERIPISSEDISSGSIPKCDYTWYNDETMDRKEFTVEGYYVCIIGQKGKHIPIKGDSYKANRILVTVKNPAGNIVSSNDGVKLDGISYISHHSEEKSIMKVLKYTERKEGGAIPIEKMVKEVEENLKESL